GTAHTRSLHDALPIYEGGDRKRGDALPAVFRAHRLPLLAQQRGEGLERVELRTASRRAAQGARGQDRDDGVGAGAADSPDANAQDRESTRLNSSHVKS